MVKAMERSFRSSFIIHNTDASLPCIYLLAKRKRPKTVILTLPNLTIVFTDHVNGEMDFSKALNRLGETLIMREDSADYGSDDIGAAFQKFSVVTKELSNLMKTLVSKKRGQMVC